MKIYVDIQGTTPLLMNRFTDEAQMAATNSNRGALVGNQKPPEQDARERLHTHPDDADVVIIPGPMLLSCFIGAGRFFKAGKTKITTQQSSLVPAAMMVLEPWFPLASNGGWSVDARPIRIPATGGRIIRYRPIFHNWSVPNIELELDTDVFSLDLTRQIIDAAGKKQGLGDFRPACKGPFGRFVVTSWRTED